MPESSGSILQLQPKAKVLSNVNLLVITSQTANLKDIVASLDSAKINFTYDFMAIDQLVENSPQQKYSAILYDYCQTIEPHTANFLMKHLQWLSSLYPNTPFILITDPLGDELAVKLIQSGVNGYILRKKLDRLSEVIKTTIFDFVNRETLVAQRQDLIQQQQARIEQLEAEKQSWLAQEQAKQEHISHLSHELRNPISAIIGFAGMLKEEYYGALNPKQTQYIGLLLGAGEHLLALVKNYLDLVKIDANKQTLDLERIAVEEICQASLFMVSEKAESKNLELIFKLGDNLDFCTVDSVRLQQVLVNLLSNAIKFTEQGSVTLRVSLENELIDFSVIDTGIGISPENMTKLFKPFPQITSHHESTGLGLALSRKLAQLHGGDITVSSELGKGSCFSLTIPQHQ